VVTVANVMRNRKKGEAMNRLQTFAMRLLPLTLIAGSPALAQNESSWEDWPLADRWTVGAGYFAPDLDTTIIVTDESQTVGTGISFENNLGLDDNKTTALLGVDWRFAKRHVLSYRYFDLSRSGTTTDSTVSIAVGEEVFDVTLPIQSFFDITANEISYAYALLFDERKELSVGIGLSVQDLALGLQGTASSPEPGTIIDSRLDSTAPLPTLNIGFDYAFTDRWIFVSRLGWLAVEADLATDESLSGEIINANLGVSWHAFEHVGFFARYQLFDVDVDYLDEGDLFAIDYDYRGPVLGVDVRF
jgi:hypothetical protein